MKKLFNLTLIVILIALSYPQATQAEVYIVVLKDVYTGIREFYIDLTKDATNRDFLQAIADSINSKNPDTISSLEQIKIIFKSKALKPNEELLDPELLKDIRNAVITTNQKLREREVEALIADAARLDAVSRAARLTSLAREMQTEVGEDAILDNLELYGIEDQILLLESKIRALQK